MGNTIHLQSLVLYFKFKSVKGKLVNIFIRIIAALVILVPLSASASGGSCSMGNPVAICMDFTGTSYTEETARAGCISGTYSTGGCSSAGAIGKCTNYANDPAMASLVMSTYYYGKDAKMAEIMSSACAQTGIWTALRSSAVTTKGQVALQSDTTPNRSAQMPEKRVTAARAAKESTTSQYPEAGQPSPPTGGLCRPMQSVTNQGEPIGEPFWQCPPGVTPPSTPPAATPGESQAQANGYSMVNGTCVAQNGRPSIDPSMCKRGNVAATTGKRVGGSNNGSVGSNGSFKTSVQYSPSTTSTNGTNDSCWDASRCSVDIKSQKWSKNHDEYTIVFLSTCKDRVYVKFGLQQTDGKWTSGADGISPGKTGSWNAFNATGKARIKWVGVSKAEDDWVCSGKVRNWNEEWLD
jgi:hypothetical protein